MSINYKVGYYQKPFGAAFIEVDLTKVLYNIRGNNFKRHIDHARLLYAQERNEEYTLFKNTLPAITFSGTFSPVRNATNLIAYSSLIVLDIDHIGTELMVVKNNLENDNYVVAAWLSPSGDGLKFLIQSPAGAEDHKAVYKQAVQYFTETLGIAIDKSGSDISRLCFISHDPEIYINADFKAFEKFESITAVETKIKVPAGEPVQITLTPRTVSPKQDEVAKAICKRIYHYLKKRNLSITSSYESWIRTAFSISNTFDSGYGINMFLDLCRLDGSQHDEFESEKLIINCYNKGSSGSSFKTIIFLAQEQGYQLDFNKKTKRAKQ